ncbi:MAG: YdcF family protein [Planctomycetes bacterium]|nr:YdcF family protein [Planctomycetota bacterium]
MTFRKKALVVIAALIGLAGLTVGWSEARIVACGAATYDRLADLPANRVAIVLGTARLRADGSANPYFDNRIAAAAEVFAAGKAEFLVVSGDNGTTAYNEPREMKEALVARGVPEARVYCDYAGFRTLDSMCRITAIFSQQSVTVVSQRFHNERAIYLARSFGVAAVGYNAMDVDFMHGFKTGVRERLARVRCFLDVNVFGTGPHFYGEKIAIR